MLRRLKSGEFDERAFGGTDAVPVETAEEVETTPVPYSALGAPSDSVADDPPLHQQSLDEIILDYLIAGDDK